MRDKENDAMLTSRDIEIRRIHRYAASVRREADRLPGVDGEYVDYLVDRCSERPGSDIDEYRALVALSRDAARVHKHRFGQWNTCECGSVLCG